MSAIEADELVISFDARRVVDEVSFRVETGEVVALIGPNGAGKTTTVETLEGFRQPSSGKARVLGLDPKKDHEALVKRVGIMLQGGGLYPMMGPRRALRLFASYYDRPADPDELLDLVGLSAVARTPAKRLSGGERQRLSLALALVGQPEVVFLDEPTSGVDAEGRRLMRSLIAQLRSEGKAVLLTSHELDEVERMSDRVVVLNRGRVVEDGRPGELAGERAIWFRAAPELDFESLRQQLDITIFEGSPGSYEVRAADTARAVAALTAWLAESGIAFEELRVGAERLEEVFLRLTSDTTLPGNDG